MTSQLNVDTIVDKAGSGGTNVKIANTSVAVAEGGSATTNTVQGLAKVWHTGSSDGTSLEDSFNVTTLTDTGTGRQTLTLSNNMTNALYAVRSAIHEGQSRLTFCDNRATSSYESAVYAANNSAYQDGNQNSVVHGDLA